jgi:PDZ domain
MKSAGALNSRRRRCLIAAAIAATAFFGARALAQSVDEPAASAAWKTAAAASSPAPPIVSSDAKPSPAASAGATTRDAPIAEVPMPVSIPRAAASPAADLTTNAGPSNLVPTQPSVNYVPNSNEAHQIPVAGSIPDEPPASSSADSQSSTEPNQITDYEQEQSGMPPEQLQRLREYDSGEDLTTPIGMELREERRALKSGEEADGLLVVAVAKGSPAAEAGLHASSSAKHDVATGVAIAAAMFFPPAILLIPALDYSAVGQSYDLIIGVDGSRVRNFLDFQDRTRNLEPGEMIYLSVVRDGKRLQVTVTLPPAPPNLTQATN